MVSIFSSHFFNWTEQLKDSGHEVYWLDVFDSNTKVEKIDFVRQIIGWRYKWNYPGRYLVKQKLPFLNKFINKFNERDLARVFEQKLLEIKPDVVHSFTMHLGCFPINEIMIQKPQVKWSYSSWGSDLFYYQNQRKEREKIRKVLPRIDYMFSDCYRDYKIASDLGFKGKISGVFPGGGGFKFTESDLYITKFSERRLILIKGYQGKHGRCINVLRALKAFQEELSSFNIVVFGANIEVLEFTVSSNLSKWENFKILKKIEHRQVLKLMGEARIYIGNSLSDGMPNTLLEAIIMGAFPVQSNPGGVTAELIKDGENGLLIKNPEDIDEISNIFKVLIKKKINMPAGVEVNLKELKPLFEREVIKNQVLNAYKLME